MKKNQKMRKNKDTDENIVRDIRNSAIRFLSRRSYTEAELRKRLQRKNFPDDLIEQCLGQLREADLIDDEKFAKEYVAYARKRKPMGSFRLRHELKKRGVDESIIDQVVGRITPEQEEEVARFALRRRGELSSEGCFKPENARQLRRLFSYLARRGFSKRTARRVLDFDELDYNDE